MFRYIKKFLKTGDLIYICDRKKHPKKFPTRFYMPNNLKGARKVKEKK